MGAPYRKGSYEAQLTGRIGGLTRWALDPEGAAEQLASARLAFERKFKNEQERKLWFTRLHLRAAQGRARKARRERPVTQPLEETTATD